MPDNGVITAEWYPLNYNDYKKEIPIIIFILGLYGNTNDRYAKEIAL